MEIVIDWKVGQKRGTQIPPCLGAGSFSWGMIVLSQEQTELSPTMGSYQKKNERMECVLKNIGTISKRTECILNQECVLNHIEVIKRYFNLIS